MSGHDAAPVRVLLVDDHDVVLHGLAEFFDHEPGVAVAGRARTGEDALALLASTAADVALIDLRLPSMDGIALCREIRQAFPATRCLILTSFGDEDSVIEAMACGASGFVLKESPLEEVARAVKKVAGGESPIDPSLTAQVFARLRSGPKAHKLELLTAQERRILELVSEGLSNKQIAERLFLADQTVKNYVSSILSKLEVQGRTQAAVFLLQRGAPPP
ncbi:MAG TPA: response regulator transcription factor [Actinomycetota bacterium]|nr:response regulator transcription factor [Actinomycetota bacterium]